MIKNMVTEAPSAFVTTIPPDSSVLGKLEENEQDISVPMISSSYPLITWDGGRLSMSVAISLT